MIQERSIAQQRSDRVGGLAMFGSGRRRGPKRGGGAASTSPAPPPGLFSPHHEHDYSAALLSEVYSSHADLSSPSSSSSSSSFASPLSVSTIPSQAPSQSASAFQFSSQPSSQSAAVRTQVTHYFSDANWTRDRYLRSLADGNGGWVPVSSLLSFSRLVDLGADAATVLASVADHPDITVHPDGTALRKTSLPPQFVVDDGGGDIGDDEDKTKDGRLPPGRAPERRRYLSSSDEESREWELSRIKQANPLAAARLRSVHSANPDPLPRSDPPAPAPATLVDDYEGDEDHDAFDPECRGPSSLHPIPTVTPGDHPQQPHQLSHQQHRPSSSALESRYQSVVSMMEQELERLAQLQEEYLRLLCEQPVDEE